MYPANKIRLTLEWVLLLSLVGFAIWLRFYNLGRLGLWGDEGFTYLSVEGILKHGYPILPSGNPYLKDILFSYLSSIPPLFGGMGEFSIRFTNALFGVLLIPAFYFVSKRFLPLPFALMGAVILTLSHWEIEFARHARYYCQLQFFYLLSLYFFYTGFIEERRRDVKFAFLFFVLACLSHQLAYTLIFSFVVLLWVKGFRVLLKPRVLLYGLLYAFVVGGLQLFEVYFWKVGSVVHLDQSKTLWEVLFGNFHLGYFKQFQWLFPHMSWVAAGGAFIYLFRRREPLSFFMGIGVLCLLFMGLGQAHFQPRYIFYLFPLFVLAYMGGLYFLFKTIPKLFQSFSLPRGGLVGGFVVGFLLILTVDACNPHYSVRITKQRK